MSELGLGPKVKEVKRPRLNPFLLTDKVGVVDFVAGGMHSLALDKNNQLWSWGTNDSGVLGRDTSGKEKLRDIEEGSDSEDEIGELNESESTPGLVQELPYDPKVFPDIKIVQLAATDNLSAILYSTGEVFAWGTFRCNEGVLGFSEDIKIQTRPTKISELKDIVKLSSGKDHIIALSTSGHVFGWGNGQQYQLARKVLERTRLKTLRPASLGIKNIVNIGSGESHSFAIDKKGDVYSWGLNQFGQCGTEEELEDNSVVMIPTKVDELSGKDIIEIVGGEHHSLALSKDGSVYVFGRYDLKEIGIKKDKLPEYSYKSKGGIVRAVPLPTKLEDVPKFRKVTAGSHHSFGISEDGVLFSWGFCDTYAVGLGPLEEDVEVPTRIANTATKDHDIQLISAGGQFSISGGLKLSDEEAEKREDKYED
ncbi:Ran guanyl-nucleotide exchange factor [Ascoidea rubescens DSM 1968]|uniref:RCC1/BLIP-II protein n=1 Tax=Ascoidea rubescens DSM 1968 TaxID=1344418 RepID=A0A1D2VMG4_9ASCO|nr:RCC1/BLIP-II protein [Ascoidea rubescens DSM 1968]ODV62806.1 RCC1/BLIP-II protein [Ascoidea rubescens DSM 1968]